MTLRQLTVITLFVALCFYIGVHFGVLLLPPPLELISPAQGLVTSSKSIEIQGKTEPGASVTVNLAPILINNDGSFSTLLTLGSGINSITVRAKKPHSHSRTIERQIFILGSQKLSGEAQSGI